MRRSKPQIAIIIVLLLGLLIFGGVIFLYNTATDIFKAVSPAGQGKVIPIEVANGENATQIANDLQKKGLIRNSWAFVIWARIKGLDAHLEAGIYKQLNTSMTVSDIIDKLLDAVPDAIRVVIPEGMRLEQIDAILSNAGLAKFSGSDFLKFTKHISGFPDTNKYPLLFNGLPQTTSMEGLLFPSSYEVPTGATTRDVVNLLLTTMNDTIQQNHLDQMAQQHKLSVYQMLTLASLVEREALFNSDRAGIAAVYWNRIYKPNAETNSLLQADPTVQYARDTDTPPGQGGKYWTPLADSGGKIDPNSPWNTYNNAGFPPTPICSPGLASMKGAAAPSNSDNYYFLSKKDGTTVFAKTYQEFLQDEQMYLQ